MNLLTIAPALMAGVAFLVGFYHLLIYSRIKQRRFNLTFAFTCFLVGVYDFFTTGLYLSTSSAEGWWWGRAQITTIQGFAIAFLWFILDYTGHKSRKIPYIFSVYYISQVILSILNPYNILQDPSIPNIKHFDLAFGLEITYYEVKGGILNTLQGLVLIVGFGYITAIIIEYFRGGHPKEARPLFAVIALFFIGAFNDAAIIVDLYQNIYLMEYSYIFMVIFMTYTISKTVVDAAVLEQAVRDSETRYRRIVEGVNDGLGVVDRRGIITYANNPLCKILGYEANDFLGHYLREFLDAENLKILDNERIRGRKKQREGTFELEWKGSGGRKIPTLISSALSFDKDGHFMGSIAVITDITERKRSEETLKKLYDETRKISDMKSNLITFVSHELKTPIVPILGWAQLMERALNEGLDLNKIVEKEGVEGIIRSADRLSKIISSFLDIDQLERGTLDLEKEESITTVLLDNAIKELLELARRKNITIKNVCEKVALRVDGFRIEQVFINILSNAIKYSPPDTTVEISSERNETEYILYFRDQGFGFSAEELRDVWDPFSTVYLRKKDTAASGTGIGLRLAKGIIEQHGGHIEISSPGLNQGSTVKIVLPLIQ